MLHIFYGIAAVELYIHGEMLRRNNVKERKYEGGRKEKKEKIVKGRI